MVSQAFSLLDRLTHWTDDWQAARSEHVARADRRHPVIAALLVALAYYLGTLAGFEITPVDTPIAPFWPPNAILLAAFLLTEPRLWWTFLVAALPTHYFVHMRHGIPALSAFGWFLANSAEALLGAWSIRYFNREEPLFQSVRGVFAFLVFGAFFAPVVTSFLDAAVAVVTGPSNDYWMMWTTRLTSNVISILTIVPTVVTVVLWRPSSLRNVKMSRILEALVLGLGVVISNVWVFHSASNANPAWMCAPLPFLVWAAVRFGTGAASTSLLITAVSAILSAIHGRSLLVTASTAENVLFLHVLLTTFALPLFLVAALISEKRLAEDSLRSTRNRLIEAQEIERTRVARELHDDVVQQVTLIELNLERLRATAPPSIKPHLDSLYQQSVTTAEAIRDLSHHLHPFALEYAGLAPALRSLCRQSTELSSIPIDVSLENVPPDLRADTSLCLYRLAQEALQNVVKHSRARHASVRLNLDHGRLQLKVADDGVGMASTTERSGLGLTSMRERVATLNGEVKITSAAGQGTVVEAWLPL